MHEIDLRKIDLNLLLVFQVLMAERSVTRAAERLGRTQSAVSHALGRLREQLADPLLVKTAHGMRASAYAEALTEKVRPILADIQRVLAPAQAFEPAYTERIFRLALPDLAQNLFAQLLHRVQQLAPHAALEWTAPSEALQTQLLEGSLDLAIVPSSLQLADGLQSAPVGDLHWACFGRADHPARGNWGVAQWSAWPHVVVRVGNRLNSPVSQTSAFLGIERRIGAWVPNFSAVAPLLAQSDLLATLPAAALVDATALHRLQVQAVPFAIAPMPHGVVWSARHATDAAVLWLRGLLESVWSDMLRRADALVPHPSALQPAFLDGTALLSHRLVR